VTARSTNGHTSSSSLSTPTIPSEIDWKRLSPQAAWTTVHIAWPMSSGLSTLEVARQTGLTTGQVTKGLKRLRVEIERQNGT
jgi:hypothetical protein